MPQMAELVDKAVIQAVAVEAVAMEETVNLVMEVTEEMAVMVALVGVMVEMAGIVSES